MVEIQIEDKTYEVPTQWEDITLEWWCGLYTIIKKYVKPKFNEENHEMEEQKIDEFQTVKMNKEIFLYVTGIKEAMMRKLDSESVSKAVLEISSLMEEYKPKYIDSFEFEEETYYFPKEFLKQNTFGDYIESTHLEQTIDIMKHGRFDVLPEQMAILCRTATEEYNDDVIPKKTERFKKLRMDIVWEFAFFLTMQSGKLLKVFQTYSGVGVQELEQAREEFLQKGYTKNILNPTDG
jgi:hypothetical protein